MAGERCDRQASPKLIGPPDGLRYEIEIPERFVETICAWGPRHGPVILLIRAADRSSDYSAVSSEDRVRSTLAHEICHRLMSIRKGHPSTPRLVMGRPRAVVSVQSEGPSSPSPKIWRRGKAPPARRC